MDRSCDTEGLEKLQLTQKKRRENQRSDTSKRTERVVEKLSILKLQELVQGVA